ncbi:hypothetical protein AGOR_G00131580 [Albula goreensis]|uniref:Uncharacterized protein n=1 Tax=Albula goreensis TaxID=1534307 RepID=A0A8T3D7J1_9TELE|nr:hypothetical protein AGOR_G00131580 [Albula goreensis]
MVCVFSLNWSLSLSYLRYRHSNDVALLFPAVVRVDTQQVFTFTTLTSVQIALMVCSTVSNVLLLLQKGCENQFMCWLCWLFKTKKKSMKNLCKETWGISSGGISHSVENWE